MTSVSGPSSRLFKVNITAMNITFIALDSFPPSFKFKIVLLKRAGLIVPTNGITNYRENFYGFVNSSQCTMSGLQKLTFSGTFYIV
jgi:hypothetical protein